MNHQDTKNTKERGTFDQRIEDTASRVIGAAIEVHRLLGPGYLESVYEEVLDQEFRLAGLSFNRQVLFGVDYKGHRVGEARLDFLVGGCVVVELKSVELLAPIHLAQAISYLKATGHRLALLLNFNVPRLKDGLKRVVL